MNTAGWVDFLSILTSFILSCLFDFFICFLWAEDPSDMTVPIIPAVVVFVLIIVAAAGFAVYKKKKGERFRSNSAKLSYIISVLLSILKMVILNLCKRVGLCFFFSFREATYHVSTTLLFVICIFRFDLTVWI